jgi:hypothetical protein
VKARNLLIVEIQKSVVESLSILLEVSNQKDIRSVPLVLPKSLKSQSNFEVKADLVKSMVPQQVSHRI